MPARAVDTLTYQLDARLPSLSRWLRHFIDMAGVSASAPCRLLSVQLTAESIRLHQAFPIEDEYLIELKPFRSVLEDIRRYRPSLDIPITCAYTFPHVY